ncbi:MAG: hypothetical protein JXA33_28665 [Anaerolineae bacterium]|nr:hypothetical protein [Anaerolineae bacterium]
MSLQSTIYIIASLISAATTLLLAIYARRRRDAYSAVAFGWMMVLATWWSVLGILYLLTNDPSVAVILRRLEYIAIAGIPVAWLLFTLRFTRQDWWLTPTWIAALCTIPILTQFIIWTDGWLHHLWLGVGNS